MPRFAANLSMLYTGARLPRPLRRRGAPMASARSSTCSRTRCARRRRSPRASAEHGLQQVLFNGAARRLGRAASAAWPCLPGREDEFRRAHRQARSTTPQALRCPRVHVMAGLVAGRRRARGAARHLSSPTSRWAARRRRAHGVDVLIEPINTRDIPGYLPEPAGRGARASCRGRRAEPEGADGPVPLPDRRGRRGDEAPRSTCPPAASATCRSPACPSATSPTSAR